MHASQPREAFVCAECDTDMELVRAVPVLESLEGHAVHRCVRCGHILLVQEKKAPECSAGWLCSVSIECQCAISYASLVWR